MAIFRVKTNEQKDNSIKLSNINAGMPFKISWKNFKKIHHTCDLEGKQSDACRKALMEAGIKDFIDE